MGVPRIAAATLGVGLLGALTVSATGIAHRKHGVRTTAAPQVVGLVDGVKVKPILTVGDVVGGYQMSGWPDGGGFTRRDGAIEFVMNHETADANLQPGTEAADAFGSRVSHLTLNRDGSVRRARYIVRGVEGYNWFCSGNLTVLNGKPWYFTGEEATFGPHGGTSIAVDVENGTFKDLPWFGFLAHEQELPLTRLRGATFILSEDGPKSKSQLYAYNARSFDAALDGRGQLGVFVPDTAAPDGDWTSADLAKGTVLAGHFAPIDQATENANADALEAAAQAKGAFDFVRVEDVAQSKTDPRVVYFTDTGSKGHESVRGRVYRMVLDRHDPTKVTIEVILDGDAGDDIVNPDNIGTSRRTLLIQEDRNSEHRFSADMGASTGYSRVIAYDLATGATRVVARVDTPADIAATSGEGAWETTGAVDASSLWGRGWWTMEVQAHGTTAPQPGNPALLPNTATNEGGQLLRIYIPGT